MAIVTRYFSTTGAGAADGTTWADRAALFSAGAWSAVITGFSFAGSDSLECLVGPGTYTITAALGVSPSAANGLFLHGCDSSGNKLTPPDPNWKADLADFDDSGLPVLDSTTNVSTIACFAQCRLLKFTASGRNGAVLDDVSAFDWCVCDDSTNNSSALAFGSASKSKVSNSVFRMTGAAYNAAVRPAADGHFVNCKIVGVAGSSGNRNGVDMGGDFGNANGGGALVNCVIVGHGGKGIYAASSGTSFNAAIVGCVVANNGGDGIEFSPTASQAALMLVSNCMITGNGGYGVDGQSSRILASNNRLRDNSSGNITSMGNYPTGYDNYTTDSDDASEYVNAGSEDFRIKNSATIWGSGYGVSEQAASGGGHVIGG